MRFLKNKLTFIILLLLTSCSSIPSNTANSCTIFEERYFWYKHSKKSEQKWGTPIYIQLAIIKMESGFDWLAKPKRQKSSKLYHLKDHQAHLVIHKQSKELGNCIKKKQEIN